MPAIETQKPPYFVADPIIDSEKISKETQECLNNINSILGDQQKDNDKLARYQKAEKELEEILYHYRIIGSFYIKLINILSNPKGPSNGSTIDGFNSLFLNGLGKEFLDRIKKFSCRFNSSKTEIDSNGYPIISFVIEYPNGLGQDLQIEEIKVETSTPFFKNKTKIDIKKTQV